MLRYTLMRMGLVASLLILGLVAGCASHPTYSLHGAGLIETRASSEVVARAVRETHHIMGDWKRSEDGSQRDESVEHRTRTWSTDGSEDAKDVIGHSETRFNDSAGHPTLIRWIVSPERSTLIFIEYGGDPLTVTNHLVRSLEQSGVEHKH